MTPMTRNVLSEGAQRVWVNCFGLPVEVVELPVSAEIDRLTISAMRFADDLRYLPEYGLADASLEERFIAAWAWCRVLRDVEMGRIGRGR